MPFKPPGLGRMDQKPGSLDDAHRLRQSAIGKSRSARKERMAARSAARAAQSVTHVQVVGKNDVAGAKAAIAAERRSAITARKAWQESLHPRDDEGKFS